VLMIAVVVVGQCVMSGELVSEENAKSEQIVTDREQARIPSSRNIDLSGSAIEIRSERRRMVELDSQRRQERRSQLILKQEAEMTAELHERIFIMNPIRKAQEKSQGKPIDVPLRPRNPKSKAPAIQWEHDDPELESYLTPAERLKRLREEAGE